MIIPVYFQPYEDELLYSWICRLAKANNMSLLKFRNFYLGDNKVSTIDSVYFSGVFWNKIEHEEFPDMKDVLFKHTGYWATRLMYKEHKIPRDIHQLLYSRNDPLFDLPGFRQKTFLRICPECLKEDAKEGKEFYFKTWHSFENVKVCCKHGCSLLQMEKFPVENEFIVEELIPVPESFIIADALYKMYIDPFYLDRKLEKIFCKDKFEIMERCNNKELELLQDYNGICEVKCKKCGTCFWTTPYAINAGRDCPICELSQNVAKKMIETVPGYKLAKNISSLNERESIKHLECGKTMGKKTNVMTIAWEQHRCMCEQCMTNEKMYAKYNLKGFEILKYKRNRTRDWSLWLKCKKCGHVFDVRVYSNLTEIDCPKCTCTEESKFITKRRKRNQKKFDNKVKELTGDEYIRISDYMDMTTPVEMLHKKCGTVFPCTPSSFLKGKRCSCDNELLTKEVIYQYFLCFEPNFKILKEPKKGNSVYVIRFDGTGKLVKITPKEIKQEATCLCEPKYFRRIERAKVINKIPKFDSLEITSETIFKKKLKELVGDEYVLIGKYVDLSSKVDILHKKCGTVLTCRPSQFLRGRRCRCDNEVLSVDRIYQYLQMFEQNFRVIKIPSEKNKYFIIEFDDNNKSVKLTAKQIKQEATCLCQPLYFIRKENAVIPVPCNFEKIKFEKTLISLVGDEYILIGDYKNRITPVKLLHVKCGKIIECTPARFLRGQRCKCEGKVKKEDVHKYLNMFEQNFKVLKFPSMGDCEYTIQFNGNSKTVRLTGRMIRQEAMCLCEPKYFKRKINNE